MSETTIADGQLNGNGRGPSHSPSANRTHLQPIGGPVSVAWREGTLTRAYELEALCDWITTKHTHDGDQVLVGAVKCHLAAARDAALGKKLDPRKRFRIFRDGPLIERARSNLDAAEAQLLNFAPPDYLLGQMPSLLRHVQRHLRPADPGRHEFERIAGEVHDHDGVHRERGKIVTTVRAASSEALRVNVRLRSFRNVVVLTTVLMAVLAFAVALMGFLRPTWLPLCFAPEESGKAVVVCPTGQSEPFTRRRPAWRSREIRRSETSTMWSPRRPSQKTSWSSSLSGLPPPRSRPRPPSGTSKAHRNAMVCRLHWPR